MIKISPNRAKINDFYLEKPCSQTGKSEIVKKVGGNPMYFSFEMKSGGKSQLKLP